MPLRLAIAAAAVLLALPASAPARTTRSRRPTSSCTSDLLWGCKSQVFPALLLPPGCA
jgi:hypothetical protein